jgi:hypothetical protein
LTAGQKLKVSTLRDCITVIAKGVLQSETRISYKMFGKKLLKGESKYFNFLHLTIKKKVRSFNQGLLSKTRRGLRSALIFFRRNWDQCNKTFDGSLK